MKKILSLIAIVIIGHTSFAQLKVLSNGNVGIGTFLPKEQLQIGDRWTFTNYGSKAINYNSYWDGVDITRLVDGYSSSIRFTDDGSINFDRAAYGLAGSSVSLSLSMTITGSGYIGIGSSYPSYPLDVYGQIRGASFIIASDQKFKTNIGKLEKPLHKVLLLNGASYDMKLGDTPLLKDGRKSYGFIAQEIQKVLPDLVFADNSGMLAVDYIAIIPYLVEAIKEQNEEIAQLKKMIGKDPESPLNNRNEIIPVASCRLYQNNPNPFRYSTQIKSEIASDIRTAKLYIYDMNGAQKQNIDISARNTIVTEISATSLKPGMYYYSLVCDGQEVDTKRMIITE